MKSLFLIPFLAVASANAGTWYVDSSAAGGGNGTSWASAWTSLSTASSVVKAGDTVYISGGPTGSSQTYSVGTWSPTGGAAGNPVTYKIGQDAAHNGTAVLSGSGTFLGSVNNVAIVGDAGDGNMHFTVSGDSAIMYNANVSGVRIGYVNFGQMAAGSGANLLNITSSANSFEFDHNYVYETGSAANAVMLIQVGDSTWDQTKIHDNTLYFPHQAGNPGSGADCMEIAGSGFSIYSNTIVAYDTTYNGSQHSDGWQALGAIYVKIHDNTFVNIGNYDMFGDAEYNFQHVWVYNNIGIHTLPVFSQVFGGSVMIYPDSSANTGLTFSDIVVANNLTDGYLTGGFHVSSTGTASASWSGVAANNIILNGGSQGGFDFAGGLSPVDNVVLTAAQGASYLTTYTTTGGLNNNYHLTSAAANLIGKAANESAYFTTDKGGGVRPASGAWDVGPYEYGSTSGGSGGGGTGNTVPPTVSAITQNASDVDPVTAGVQVYEGTAVQYSGSGSVPSGDTMTWTWSYAINGGTSTTFQTGSGTTVPSVSYTYATGTGGQTYVWTLTIKDTTTQLSAQSSLTMSVEAPPAAGTNLTFLAGQYASLTAPLVLSGGYLSQPVQTTVISQAGEAVFNFSVTNAGNYVIQALVNAPSDSANSFYVNIDAQPVDPTMCWDIPITSGFQQELVSWRGNGTDTNNQFVPEVFSLAAGNHQIIFAGREAGTQLQSFSVLQLLAAPQNLHVLPTVVNSPTFSIGGQ